MVDERPTDQRQLLLRPQLRHNLHAVAEGAADRFFKILFQLNLITNFDRPLTPSVFEVLNLALLCHLDLRLKPKAFRRSGS